MTQSSRVFPAGLLLEGRQCLVVGGGKIATHKTDLLHDSGAVVSVVAPTLSGGLADLAKRELINWIARGFEPGDLDGKTLVYAATDDTKLNRQVLDLCRERGILCCAVDSGWRHGDFVTPAIVRHGDLTVSISTSGRACRRSRLVKNSLARHIDSISSAGLVVLGTSHEQLSVAEREPLHLVGRKMITAGRMLSQIWGLHEYVILNTCNRIELLAIGVVDEDRVQLLKRIMGFEHLPEDKYYLMRDLEAFEHSCALCAGLLSQMPGENHIVAQVKQALVFSTDEGWAAGMMQEWMSAALHVSKDVRQVTAPHLHGREIEDLAVDYLSSRFGDKGAMRMLVLGTGKTGAGFLEKVLARFPGLQVDWCYHQNCPQGSVAIQKQVRLYTMQDLADRLAGADVVVSAMSADQYIVTPEHAGLFGHGRNVLLMDLAMPRNIDASLGDAVPSLEIVDLDSLKHWHRREQIDLEHLRELCRGQVEGHKEYYDKLINSFQGRNKGQ